MKTHNYEEVLKLYDSLIIFVDTKNQVVNLVIDGANEIANDITYHDFSLLFAQRNNYTEETVSKMDRFLTNLKVTSEAPFEFLAKYQNTSLEFISTIISGKAIDEDNVILSFKIQEEALSRKTDGLTKALSTHNIKQVVQKSIQANKSFVLMLFDIDYFATFNEKYGRFFGDIILVETAASIRKFVKDRGVVARESGDRFMVYLEIKDDYDYIHDEIARFRNTVMELTTNNVKRENITATIGCASYPKDGSSFDELYLKSYLALQRGKKKGRNCFIIYLENKCGGIEGVELPKTKFDYVSNIATNFNIVSGVYEIINKAGTKERNLTDALSLIGSYFLLDRINFTIINPETQEILNILFWCNPAIETKRKIPKKENIKIWNQAYDNLGMLKIVQVESNKDNPVYPLLSKYGTTSILAISLRYNNYEIGQITFEMVTGNRFWDQVDVAALHLISKLFAINLYKDYEANELRRQISIDKLTNIHNYYQWYDDVSTYIADNPIEEYAIIITSIPNFQHIGDLYGKKVADDLLIITANALVNLTNKELFARSSEDRFIVFSTEIDQKDIIGHIEDVERYIKSKFKYSTQFKIAVGVYIANRKEKISDAVDKANLSRKYAINKNIRYQFFSQEIFEADQFNKALEMHQKKAIDNQEFLLYLQPKVDTKSNRLVGAEALTRWYYKNNRLIYPNTFIPLFEKNGFIMDLDLHVFENVCKFQRDILDAGLTPVTISINLSMYPGDFDKYIDTISEIKERYHIPTKYLEIEITESMYIKDIEKALSLVNKLHQRGYKISMDDFGAGYSSLSSLSKLDFDTLKIDKDFCSKKDNKKEKAILKFIMQMAKDLKVSVLCEGVETKENVDFLKSIGCTLIQGYYFDKPMPSDDFKKKYLLDIKRKIK